MAKEAAIEPGSVTIVEQGNEAASIDENIFVKQIEPKAQYELSTKRKVHLPHKLGEGRFGVVYLGVVKNFFGLVSKKVFKFLRYSGSNSFDLFGHEAQLMMELEHEGVLGINEIALIEGVPVIVMDYFPSRNLKEVLSIFTERPYASDSEKVGGIPANFTCLIMSEVADALNAMHAKGVVHRDIKSGNVLVGLDGRTKLTDFGVSYQPGQKMTVAGTLKYMAPEQVERLIREDLDKIVPKPAHDIWSLGIVLWELLTGQEAFSGARSYEDLHNRQSQDPPLPLDTIPPGLANLLLQMLVFNGEGRTMTAAEVSRQLFLYNKNEHQQGFTTRPIRKLFETAISERIQTKHFETASATEMLKNLEQEVE